MEDSAEASVEISGISVEGKNPWKLSWKHRKLPRKLSRKCPWEVPCFHGSFHRLPPKNIIVQETGFGRIA